MSIFSKKNNINEEEVEHLIRTVAHLSVEVARLKSEVNYLSENLEQVIAEQNESGWGK